MKLKNCRYIAFDLDGTILDSKSKLNERAIKMIENIRNANIGIVIASGRHIEEIKEMFKNVVLHKNDYIISSDGLYVYNGKFDRLNTFSYLSPNDVLNIVEKTSDNNIRIVTDKYDYFIIDESKIENILRGLIRNAKYTISKLRIRYVRKRNLHMIKNIEKTIVCIKKVTSELIKYNYNAFYYSEERTDIFSKDVDKYYSIKWICEKECIDENQILYFGNDINDILCFEKLENSICLLDNERKFINIAKEDIEYKDGNGLSEYVERMLRGIND